MQASASKLTRLCKGLLFSAVALVGACDRGVASEHAARTRPPVAGPSPADQAAADFVAGAMGDDLFEARTAQIAAARAQAPAVKALAAASLHNSADSTQALNRSIAESGRKLPAPPGLSDHLQSMLNQLSRGTAKDFDKTYIEQQVEANQDALNRLSAYAGNGAIPALKAAAGAMAPVREAQLDQARSIQDELNKTP